MQRRDFLLQSTRSASALIAVQGGALDTLYRGLLLAPHSAHLAGNELRIPTDVSARALALSASATRVDRAGWTSTAWTLNAELPGATIRARRGDIARISFENDLAEPTILHWHGLIVPESFDGHPRLAIEPGACYEYEFPIEQRAGTYWYHPHAHHRTGAQVYMGLTGLFLVADDEEDALGLPSGRYEVPLVLRDGRFGDDGLTYDPSMHDMMTGLLGNAPIANGTTDAWLRVDRARYRLRIVNGSNARIFKLALSNGAPLTLIGTDGGLLAAPESVQSVLLAPAERADVLVDFRGSRNGERIELRSLPFTLPEMVPGVGAMRGRAMGMGGAMARMPQQGTAMTLLQFRVDGPVVSASPIPSRLSTLPLPGGAPAAERTFRFASSMMQHSINGREFELERVDVKVPLGQTERWSFINDSLVPHPVHLHATHFRVLARRGGRNALTPPERGLKDTVLVLPGEQVDVLVRFERHRGLFLLHCHNLEHEDAGMMANVEVV